MKIRPSSYQPFAHEDFDYVKGIIQAARNSYGKNPESTLTAVLIYVNAVDYIAGHLLENLQTMIHFVGFNHLNSDIYLKNRKFKRGRALGQVIGDLKNYHFTNDQAFINDLERFNSYRKMVVHNLLRLTKKQKGKLDDDVKELKELAEDIVIEYDAIVRSLRNVWEGYLIRNDSLAQSQVQQSGSEQTPPKPKDGQGSKID